jgi:hypothetical protein
MSGLEREHVYQSGIPNRVNEDAVVVDKRSSSVHTTAIISSSCC